MQQATQPGFAACHGCSLCLLPCPMWRAHRDVSYSPQGFAKAMQAGASASDLADQLVCCIQCGACDVMCPEQIDLSGMVSKLWKQAGLSESIELSESIGLSESIELPDSIEWIPQPSNDKVFAMSKNPMVQAQLSCKDLYIIDAAPFHTHHAERVQHYDALRHSTGCSMNLDLNRMAIPTGADSVSARMGKFDVAQQLDWLMQGHDFKRIVVECELDQSTLAKIIDQPVIHVSKLLE
ncbi:MAG: 4Fe-4S dicluster domain-containing protein [Mariprofundus sp.]|nr:4Fe-4S dicluster domain-containing protein [Mariprofundus sp.]